MKWKIRELSYLERAALLDVIQAFSQNEMNIAATIEIISRAVEIENEPLMEVKLGGVKIRKLSDEQLERLLDELTPEQIGAILQEIFKVNKFPFFGQKAGGTNTEDTSKL